MGSAWTHSGSIQSSPGLNFQGKGREGRKGEWREGKEWTGKGRMKVGREREGWREETGRDTNLARGAYAQKEH